MTCNAAPLAGPAFTRAATRSTAGAGAGVIAAGQRRRMMAADPTRGPIRRGAGTLLTPVSLLTGGLRGAALGPQDAHRRSFRTMSKAQVNAVKATNTANAGGSKKVTPGKTGRTGTTANVRAAGSSHGTARDAATVDPRTPLRRPPTPENRTGATDSAEEAETFDTVSLQRAPLPETDQIPRPAPTEQLPRPDAPDPAPSTWRIPPPLDAGDYDDDEPDRRPLEPASAGQA